MHRKQRVLLLALAAISTTRLAVGQQTYVTRYDYIAGYAFLDSPAIGLFENGFQMQAGVRANTWLSLGFDYSLSRGDLTLTPNLLPNALQAQLGAELGALIAAGMIPATYTLAVPAQSSTQTFALGPQFNYRHFQQVTLFVRPSLGAIHEVATPKPGDAIAAAIAQQLAPSGQKTDWQGFYGFGYGCDLIVSHHLALRLQGDLVYDHLFNDLLRNGRWTTRFSVGPAFNFGPNIARR